MLFRSLMSVKPSVMPNIFRSVGRRIHSVRSAACSSQESSRNVPSQDIPLESGREGKERVSRKAHESGTRPVNKAIQRVRILEPLRDETSLGTRAAISMFAPLQNEMGLQDAACDGG